MASKDFTPVTLQSVDDARISIDQYFGPVNKVKPPYKHVYDRLIAALDEVRREVQRNG